MVNPMVERATSDMLIGPDWAANIEICDIINSDLGQTKDVVRGIKKRLGSKSPKVQLLVLTLLETIIKNCGDISHAHVAEKEIPHEMVKIVKKKPDLRVKEKILLLIDTWQEAFGGPTERYPQYYAAYKELLRAGVVFPQKSETSAPVLTPPRRQPARLHNQNLHSPDYQQDAPGSSTDVRFSTLSLTEIQLAQGVVDVLAEMLNALDPGNKEDIKQDVVVDLVQQCRNYKQRVIHLVNSTLDESLLCRGLSLNDDLQRVLSKHEAVASGTSVQKEKPKPELVGERRNAHFPRHNNQQPERNSTLKNNTGSGTQTVNQSLVASPATKFDPKLDLLSGDDYITPVASTSLALVPLTQQQPTTPLSEENALVPFDVHYDSNQATNPWEQSLYTNSYGAGSSMNSQVSQSGQQQPLPLTPYNGSRNNESFPPPPWEAQPVDDEYPHSMKVTQVVFTHVQNGLYHPQGPQPIGNKHQVVGVYIQPIVGSQISPLGNRLDLAPRTFHGGPYGAMLSHQTGNMAALYPLQMFGNQFPPGYGQLQQTQYLEQRMYGLSSRDDNGIRNSSYHVSSSTNVTPNRPSKPEDNLFGDLVDLAKFKSMKPTAAAAGSR